MKSSPLLACELAQELARFLDHVIICPGSRNSPLSLALLARDDIRVHTRIDERSAAFLALGMARTLRRPVGVVTTSGTAVANCLPAMTEAYHAHVPLVIISSDRPQYLVGTGANQTINQLGIFSSLVDTTEIDAGTHNLAEIIDAAFLKQQVHINVAFDTPLVDHLPARQPGKFSPRGPESLSLCDNGEVEVNLAKRTLVIAGDEAWDVAGLEDVPTIAEPTAPTPYYPVHPLAAKLFLTPHMGANDYRVDTKPEQVIVVGHPTLHRDVLALITDPDIDLIVLSRTLQFTSLGRQPKAKGSRVKITGNSEQPPRWLEICNAASELAADAVRKSLEKPEFGFTGLHVAAAVADTLGTGDYYFIGASNPVRDSSLVGLPFDGVTTISPRGTAGIDGSVSQAIGMGLASQSLHPDEIRAPRAVALVGDVTFLHDIGGLWIGTQSPAPENLTIVVSNDSGGGIFSTLEIGAEEFAPSFERAFGTPHEVDFAALANAYGVEFIRVDCLSDLIAELLRAEEVAGWRIIEAKTTRQTRRAMHDDLVKQVSV